MKNENSKLLYPELSYQIIGQAMKVHSAMGRCFLEKVYENCLMKRFRDEKIPAQKQYVTRVYFEGEDVGHYTIDILVANKIIVELKVCDAMSPDFDAQAINYLRATGLSLAIILNFGARSLEFKRIVFTDHNVASQPSESRLSPIN